MKTWAVALDITYDRYSTNEHKKEKKIMIVKADTDLEAMEKAKEKFLEGKPRSFYLVSWWCWEDIDLDNID